MKFKEDRLLALWEGACVALFVVRVCECECASVRACVYVCTSGQAHRGA